MFGGHGGVLGACPGGNGGGGQGAFPGGEGGGGRGTSPEANGGWRLKSYGGGAMPGGKGGRGRGALPGANGGGVGACPGGGGSGASPGANGGRQRVLFAPPHSLSGVMDGGGSDGGDGGAGRLHGIVTLDSVALLALPALLTPRRASYSSCVIRSESSGSGSGWGAAATICAYSAIIRLSSCTGVSTSTSSANMSP